jgi:prepilin-type N-terminal cleavage/methylation domain-containing protein
MLYRLRKQNGFTLIEVLIAAFISTVMFSGLIVGATGFFRRDSQEQQKVQLQQRLRLVSSVVASDLREAGYIYLNPTVASGLISSVQFPAGTAPKLAVLVPFKTSDGQADPEGKFVLVVYAMGPVPTAAPFTSISSIQGNVIYRWYSRPDFFDPRTQRQGSAGTGNAPDAFNGNFIIYGGAASDPRPPVLTSNIDTLTITPSIPFGPQQSATYATLAVSAFGDPLNRFSTYVQARNLGLPPVPLPTP